MTMAEVCLHGDKLDQDAISIYPHNGRSVTLFPILEGGPHDLDIWVTCSYTASLCVMPILSNVRDGWIDTLSEYRVICEV